MKRAGRLGRLQRKINGEFGAHQAQLQPENAWILGRAARLSTQRRADIASQVQGGTTKRTTMASADSLMTFAPATSEARPAQAWSEAVAPTPAILHLHVGMGKLDILYPLMFAPEED